jgi:predicted  nucleic acid-binding Zn-ribbon protein
MKATTSDQRSILEVAQLDLSLATLTNRENNLPEIAELREITLKSNTARDLRIAAETELSDVSRELSRAEADVEQIVSRIERDEKRLSEGAGSAKDLEHMQHEIGTLNIRRAELEEAELAVMMRIDAIKERINVLQEEENLCASKMAELNARKDAAMTVIQSERSHLEDSRQTRMSTISDELIKLYSKIAADNVGSAAAALVGNECKGCNLTLNTVEVQRINALAEDEVVRCEQCRCILVRNL